MKVTNLETSKKLKELGFEAETMAFIDPDSEECQIWLNAPEGLIPAYDLETILEALPKELKKLYFWISYSRCHDCWAVGYQRSDNTRNTELEAFAEENEVLANTAGRLLVKLLEDNIIKLGE